MNKLNYTCLMAAAIFTIGLSITACTGNDSAPTEALTTETINDGNTNVSEVNVANQTEDISEEDVKEISNQQESTLSEEGTIMYTTESITLHAEASGSSEDLGVVAVGSTVTAYETSGDYIKIEFDGKDGYVLKEYVTEDKAAADEALEASKQAAASSGNDSGQSDEKSSESKKSSRKSTECLENGLLN